MRKAWLRVILDVCIIPGQDIYLPLSQKGNIILNCHKKYVRAYIIVEVKFVSLLSP
jgi:hypothetical protein